MPSKWKEAFRRIPAERVRPSAVARSWGVTSSILTKAALAISRGVLVKCYPKASQPYAGLVNRVTNVILADGEVLGVDPEEIPAEPDAGLLRRMMVLLGVVYHECGHVNNSPTPAEYAGEVPAKLIEDAKYLEEARMEARLNESHPRCTPYLRAAIGHVLLESKPDEPLLPLSRAAAARQAVLVLGRVPAGTLLSVEVADVEAMLESALGAEVLDGVKEIVADVCKAPNAEATEALADGARRLQELVPPEESAGSGTVAVIFSGGAGEEGGGASGTGSPEGGGEDSSGADDDGGAGKADGEDEGARGGEAPDAGATWSDLHRAVEEAAERSREVAVGHDDREGGVDRELRELAKSIAEGGPSHGGGSPGVYGGHGFGFGPGIPPTGGRAPVGVEVIAARRLATALRAARSRRLISEGRIAPPGRFSGRGAMRQAGELARGAPVRGLAFRTRRTVVEDLWHPQVAIAVDVSGSMGPYEGPLASVLWVTHSAVEAVGGRSAVALFGDEAKMLCPPARRLTRVPVVSAVGGAEDVGEAIELLRAALPLEDSRRPRLLVLIGDGVWVSRPWLEAGERNIAELRAAGCAVVSVGIGREPVPHGEDENTQISDPLEIATVTGHACVRALAAN